MTILNLYQLAFILTIVGVVGAGYWAKKHMPVRAIANAVQFEADEPKAKPAMKASLEFMQEHIRALDVLFDDHLVSVDEYVELRKRISSGQTV